MQRLRRGHDRKPCGLGRRAPADNPSKGRQQYGISRSRADPACGGPARGIPRPQRQPTLTIGRWLAPTINRRRNTGVPSRTRVDPAARDACGAAPATRFGRRQAMLAERARRAALLQIIDPVPVRPTSWPDTSVPAMNAADPAAHTRPYSKGAWPARSRATECPPPRPSCLRRHSVSPATTCSWRSHRTSGGWPW
jgi:hypothetical protein